VRHHSIPKSSLRHVLFLIVLAISSVSCDSGRKRTPSAGGSTKTAPARHQVDEAAVRKLCGHCHEFPEPKWLSKTGWRETIIEMSKVPDFHKFYPDRPEIEQVIEWYTSRAPAQLEPPADIADRELEADSFEVTTLVMAGAGEPPMIADVKPVSLTPGSQSEDVLYTDMRQGTVRQIFDPGSHPRDMTIPSDLKNPARLNTVDLDGDGLLDILVGELGSFLPIDHSLGEAVWLRQAAPGRFETVRLASGLGRVTEVQAADLDADGDLDLVVGEFGWRRTGRMILYENRTTNWDEPEFVQHILDGRNGTVKLHVADLNQDGLPDVVALIAQGHEMLTGYINQGDWRFEARILHRAPHPGWGYCDLEACDLDADGDLDFVVANGDTLDNSELRPYYSISWIENRGELEFRSHHLTEMFGVMTVATGDIDGDGDLDIAAGGFVSFEDNSVLRDSKLPSLLWLEHQSEMQFQVHYLEANHFNRLSLSIHDFDGDGRGDLLLGNGLLDSDQTTPVIELWKSHP